MYYAKKYPIASGGLRPPDPLLQRYNFRISPSPPRSTPGMRLQYSIAIAS